MKCHECNAEVHNNAKFCQECGANLKGADSDNCSNCGEPLKPEARFCQNCGASVSGEIVQPATSATEAATTGEGRRNWMTNVGIFLFIPIFAVIIVLLFWKNEEPPPLNESNSAGSGQSMMSQQDMESVHATLERLKKNYEANPKDLVSIDSLALMYFIAGNYETASDYYEQHLKLEPDKADVKIALGVTYHYLKRNNDAISTLKEVLEKEPTHARALFFLGDIYAAMGEKEEASKNWQLIVQHHPNTEVANRAQQRIHELTQVENNSSGN